MPRPARILSYLTELAYVTPRVGNARVAAAVVKGGRIISVATNKRKTHSVQERYKKNPAAVYLHAEIGAIVKALGKLDVSELAQCDVYIARVAGTDKTVAPIHPCKGCERAIRDFQLRRVYHT